MPSSLLYFLFPFSTTLFFIFFNIYLLTVKLQNNLSLLEQVKQCKDKQRQISSPPPCPQRTPRKPTTPLPSLYKYTRGRAGRSLMPEPLVPHTLLQNLYLSLSSWHCNRQTFLQICGCIFFCSFIYMCIKFYVNEIVSYTLWAFRWPFSSCHLAAPLPRISYPLLHNKIAQNLAYDKRPLASLRFRRSGIWVQGAGVSWVKGLSEGLSEGPVSLMALSWCPHRWPPGGGWWQETQVPHHGPSYMAAWVFSQHSDSLLPEQKLRVNIVESTVSFLSYPQKSHISINVMCYWLASPELLTVNRGCPKAWAPGR